MHNDAYRSVRSCDWIKKYPSMIQPWASHCAIFLLVTISKICKRQPMPWSLLTTIMHSDDVIMWSECIRNCFCRCRGLGAQLWSRLSEKQKDACRFHRYTCFDWDLFSVWICSLGTLSTVFIETLRSFYWEVRARPDVLFLRRRIKF